MSLTPYAASKAGMTIMKSARILDMCNSPFKFSQFIVMISPLFVKGNCLGYDRGVQFFAKSYSIANAALMLLLV
jgi:hypothetical protein